MKRGLTGEHITISTVGETCKAFIPNQLPPDPPLDIDNALIEALNRASLAIGRLDGLTGILPEPALFLYMYIRKEAVLSSQIEGTQSTLTDLLLFENAETPGVPLDDVQEVSNYVAAINHGLRLLKDDLPISNRMICEIHAVLLAKGRGSSKTPGEYRRSQNWIGGLRPGNARFVPPPSDAIADCMGDLEKYIHSNIRQAPLLIKAALVHAQFETIHPFLDGNGRLGRLLITLMLRAEKMLTEPILYLSLYFKSNRDLYYELLQRVRLEGEWEEWLLFFLTGVIETAEQSVATAQRLHALLKNHEDMLQHYKRKSGTLIKIHKYLQMHPLSSISRISAGVGLSFPTVKNAINEFTHLEIIAELTGRERNKLYAYREYIDILNSGT